MVTAYFLDTSALLKRYVPEAGTDWIQAITDPSSQNLLFVSQITWVEFCSAIARRQREKSISMAQGQQVLSAFQTHWNTQYFMIQVEQAVTQLAGQLVFQHPLRAYDAIQLAAALSLQRQLSLPDVHSFIFLTADDRLCAVAQATGIATENPNQHP